MAAAAISLTTVVAASVASPVEATVADGSARWSVTVPGGRVHWSSPAIADVNSDGSADAVVGGLDGRVHAYDANGRALPGWPAPVVVRGAASAVASSPAVGDIDGDGRNEVVVGAGSLEVPDQHGGLVVLNGDGTRRCAFQTGDKFDMWGPGGPDGFSEAVWASPALGDVTGDGRPEIVFGSWDHQVRVVDGACRQLAAFDNTDTVWSPPALFDADGDGRAEIYIGGDATSNAGSHSGGFFRSLRYTGGARLEQRWVRLSSEAFQTGQAIGDVNGDGRLEVVTGGGRFYCQTQQRCQDSNKVWAFDLLTGNDVAGWPRTARYNTFLAAPAIADVNADGYRDVVIGSSSVQNQGAVLALRGDGTPLWEVEPAKDELTSPPVVADVLPDAGNEVVVASASRVRVLDGHTGATLQTLGAGAYKNAAAVGELGPGRWALVTAGFEPNNGNAATIQAFDVPAPADPGWPMYGATPDRKRVVPLGPPPQPRSIEAACPPDQVPPSGFSDVPASSPHRAAIDCAAWRGITQPAGGVYRPAQTVTRAQMASFIARMIDDSDAALPDDPPDAFTDDEDAAYAAHELNINRLAAVDIVAGRSETTYAPREPVTRGQMATFIVRAHRYVTGATLPLERSWFHDRDPVHGGNVDRAAGAGIATGFPNGTFRHGAAVRRDQMASFLVRTVAQLVDEGKST